MGKLLSLSVSLKSSLEESCGKFHNHQHQRGYIILHNVNGNDLLVRNYISLILSWDEPFINLLYCVLNSSWDPVKGSFGDMIHLKLQVI